MRVARLFFLLLPLLTFACRKGYDPCDGKSTGDPCRLCAPDDHDCVETMQVKTCNAEGECGGGKRATDAGAADAAGGADAAEAADARVIPLELPPDP